MPLPNSLQYNLPTHGTKAAGADAYASVVTAPTHRCSHLAVSVGANGAVLSLDGGTTDHIAVPASTTLHLWDLKILAGTAIHAKNLSAGSNFAALHVSVW